MASLTEYRSYRNLPALAGPQEPYDGSRRSIEVEGLAHGLLPIPAASRVGRILATGGVRGVDPATGVMPSSVEEQAINMFANLKRIVEAGGGRATDILKVTIWISSPEGRAAVSGPWLQMFPDPGARPARHILSSKDKKRKRKLGTATLVSDADLHKVKRMIPY